MVDKSDQRLLSRGQYGPSPPGTALFVGLRALDGFVLQRALQVLDPMPGLLAKLGVSVPPGGPSGGAPLTISSHHLTPFQAVIWSMSIGSAVKQIFTVLVTSKESVKPSAAITIAIFNTICNSLNTLAFSAASANPTWSENGLYISIPIFVFGLLVETVPEIQRKLFKDDPKNAGKVYTGGLWSLARHINYFGYTLWRGSMAVAAGGWLWGAFVTSFFAYNFVNMSIPELDEYMSERYGEQWEAVKRKVPYAFVPGLY